MFTWNPFPSRDTNGLNHGFSTVVTGLPTRSNPFRDATNPIDFNYDPVSGRSETRQYLEHCLGDDHPLHSLLNGGLQRQHRRIPELLPSGLAAQRDYAAKMYTDAFLDWERKRSGPWAACVNLMDAYANRRQ